MPELFIITGSNGAGKSSVGPDYLPQHIQKNHTIFDGDKLFTQKQSALWQSGMRAHKEARKIAYEYVLDTFDTLVKEAMENKATFVYEGHFTNDATWDIPKNFKAAGYKLNLIFLGLTHPDLSEIRVLRRVKQGGHFVDRRTVEDNFYGNLEKLNVYFSIIDNLQIIDSSEAEHLLIASFQNGECDFSIPKSQIPEWFSKYLPVLHGKILS